MGLSWHWHRMRAMTLEEVCLRAQLRLRQRTDSGRTWESPRVALEGIGAFPRLPSAEAAPPELREALSRDAQKILAGNWKAFGHLDLQIDDPPKWHHDYLAGRDFATTEPGFTLNHRELPGDADVKLIWEMRRRGEIFVLFRFVWCVVVVEGVSWVGG